jgi:hypothetical protein
MANVKILLVGSDQVWSLERIYLQYIREFGITSEIFACQDLFMEYYTASLWNKLKFRAGVSAVYKRINEQFEEQVKQFNPAIIWIFKGMEILPETIIRLKKKGYKFVSFNPDNPFLFSGRGSGNSNVTKSIPLYDLHFTYDRSIKLQLEKKYHLPAGLLPFGFDVNANVYKSCSLQKEVNKVCFLGNPDKERTAFITRLAEADLAIDL